MPADADLVVPKPNVVNLVDKFLAAVEVCAERLGMDERSMYLAVNESSTLFEHMIDLSSVQRPFPDEFKEHALQRLQRESSKSPPSKKRKTNETEEKELEGMRKGLREGISRANDANSELNSLNRTLAKCERDLNGKEKKLNERKKKLEESEEKLNDRQKVHDDLSERIKDPEHWKSMEVVCCDGARQVTTDAQTRLRIIEDYKDVLLKMLKIMYKRAEKKMELAKKKHGEAMKFVETLKNNVSWKAIDEAFRGAQQLLQPLETLATEDKENDKKFLLNLFNLERGFIQYSKTRDQRALASNFCIIGVVEYLTPATVEIRENIRKSEESEKKITRRYSAPPSSLVPESSEDAPALGRRKSVSVSSEDSDEDSKEPEEVVPEQLPPPANVPASESITSSDYLSSSASSSGARPDTPMESDVVLEDQHPESVAMISVPPSEGQEVPDDSAEFGISSPQLDDSSEYQSEATYTLGSEGEEMAENPEPEARRQDAVMPAAQVAAPQPALLPVQKGREASPIDNLQFMYELRYTDKYAQDNVPPGANASADPAPEVQIRVEEPAVIPDPSRPEVLAQVLQDNAPEDGAPERQVNIKEEYDDYEGVYDQKGKRLKKLTNPSDKEKEVAYLLVHYYYEMDERVKILFNNLNR